MILHRYFARRFAMTFLAVTGVFCVLLMLIDLMEQVRKFEAADLGAGAVFQLVMLNIPTAISEILPLIMILATVMMFVGLARSSELVVTRAAGRSGLRALLAPAFVALLIGVLAVSTLNPIAAATTARYNALSELYRTGGTASVSISGEGFWLRQGAETGQTVIHAERYNPETAEMFDVAFLAYAPDGGPVRRILAERAVLRDGAWLLSNAKVWPLTAGLNPEANAAEHDSLRLPSPLTEQRLRESLGSPDSISVWDMPAFIDQLESAGFSARRHQVWFLAELARPIFLISMVLVAAAFTMRHARSGGTGIAVLTAVLLGFGLYFIRSFAIILGENGQLPVMLAAWAPPMASLLLALGFLLYAEDG